MPTKYAIIIPDGAADEPLKELGGKTALEAADIPNIDAISAQGRQGMVHTIPPGMTAGSDVAQICLLGYDPVRYYSGRAPLEAVAMDIKLQPDDWCFRCNLVTFSDNKMADHSAGHISTKEAALLIEELQKAPAILRLSYVADVEPEALVEQRLKSLKSQISDAWEELNCCYDLVIEPEIHWRLGKPAAQPREGER